MNTEPLLTIKGIANGKGATVHVFPDRIEWKQAGIGRRSTEMMPVSAMSSVQTIRAGMAMMNLVVTCSGNIVELKMSKAHAEEAKQLLTQLMLGSHPSTSSTATPPIAPASIADELGKLKALHDSGALTDDEFATQKARLLG